MKHLYVSDGPTITAIYTAVNFRERVWEARFGPYVVAEGHDRIIGYRLV